MLWKNIEDNSSTTIRAVRIILLILIVVGIALIVTRNSWVPSLVNRIVKDEIIPVVPAPVAPLSVLKNKKPVACTMEAKLCSDGSYVGRTGPNCEFAACPANRGDQTSAMVNGFVRLSPTCPVERIPPDPRCAPKGFSTNIQILNSVNGYIVKTVHSNTDGSFSFSLPYGDYVIHAVGGTPYPSCTETTLSFNSPLAVKLDLSCDTGIR